MWSYSWFIAASVYDDMDSFSSSRILPWMESLTAIMFGACALDLLSTLVMESPAVSGSSVIGQWGGRLLVAYLVSVYEASSRSPYNDGIIPRWTILLLAMSHVVLQIVVHTYRLLNLCSYSPPQIIRHYVITLIGFKLLFLELSIVYQSLLFLPPSFTIVVYSLLPMHAIVQFTIIGRYLEERDMLLVKGDSAHGEGGMHSSLKSMAMKEVERLEVKAREKDKKSKQE